MRVRGAGLQRVDVLEEGVRLARRRVTGGDEVFVPVPAEAGSTVAVQVNGESAATCVLPSSAALTARVAAPAGQELRPLPDGDLPFVAFEGTRPEVALVLTAGEPLTARVRIGEHEQSVALTVAGEQTLVTRPLPLQGPTTVEVEGPGLSRRARLVPTVVARDEAASVLAVTDVRFPVDRAGLADPARPVGRVTLPGRAWTWALEAAGLGVRARDREVPWASHAVTVRNGGDVPMDVFVRSRVEADGAPAPAFQPVVRDADGGTGITATLLRVPAGDEATAVVPQFVDEDRLPEGASAFSHVVDVVPLGLSEPVASRRTPLQVSRGSSWVALGFGLAVLAACLGVGSALVGVPRWLRTFGTTDLTTIAVFATLAFVVSTATAVLASGLAAVLGPFSMLVTGLISDCLRSALLATLVVLLPRRGVATLFLLVSWLMGGIALGAFSPTDFVFVGARIFWLEAFLWLAGLTRGGGWRDGSPRSRFLRLTAGFAGASVLSMAGAMASQIVLFRLYYAGWFVVLMLALPGFLYDVLACALATSFAASLRRVQA